MPSYIFPNQDFYAEEVSYEEWKHTFSQYSQEAFANSVYINSDPFKSVIEQKAIQQLLRNLKGLFRLCLIIKKKNEIVGWSVGRQVDKETFKMVNSAILPPYRRKGLYTSLLDPIISRLKEAGFQKIDSYHHPTNNAVIIPKLKKGFFITGLEVEDEVGMRLRLTYYFNEKRRLLVQARTGAISMNSFL